MRWEYFYEAGIFLCGGCSSGCFFIRFVLWVVGSIVFGRIFILILVFLFFDNFGFFLNFRINFFFVIS